MLDFQVHGCYEIPGSSSTLSFQSEIFRQSLWRECGTHKTVKARLWPRLSGKSLGRRVTCSLFDRKQLGRLGRPCFADMPTWKLPLHPDDRAGEPTHVLRHVHSFCTTRLLTGSCPSPGMQREPLKNISRTFTCKPWPESGLDRLICAMFG